MSSIFVEGSIAFLRLCKFIGLTPINVILKQKPAKLFTEQSQIAETFDRIELLRGWKSQLPRFIIQLYQIFTILYIIGQLMDFGKNSKNNFNFLQNCLRFAPFLIFLVLGTTVYQYCRSKTVEIIEFINEFHNFETDIGQYYDTELKSLNLIAVKFYRLLKFRLFFLLLVVFPSFIWVALPSIRVLVSTNYFVGLIGGNLRENRDSLLVWSVSATTFGLMWITFFIFAGFASIVEVFPRASIAYLKLLNSERKLSSVTALRLYDRIQTLMKIYNSLFGQVLFFEQCVTFAVICITEFCWLRLPFSLTKYYLAFSLSMGYRQIALLKIMGSSYNEAINWKSNQIKALCSSDSKYNSSQFIVASIQGREPIQFVFGGFYGVTSTTILKFFSIVTTHLIVLLQIPLLNLD